MKRIRAIILQDYKIILIKREKQKKIWNGYKKYIHCIHLKKH